MERISAKDLPAGFYQVLLSGENYLHASGIDPVLLKLIKMRVSMINSCAYCIDMHYKEAIHAGETPLRLISIGVWRETNYYTPREQAVLAFAEALTYMRADEQSDHIHDGLKPFFSKEEIAYLTLAIIQINGWNRFVRSMGPEPGNYQIQK